MHEKNPYADILHLPHHQAADRKHMSMYDRAAQFSPFAALTGFDGVIAETGRLTDRKIELSESDKVLLDQKLTLIDEVAKYRQYDADGNEALGEYGRVFEEEYYAVLADYRKFLNPAYLAYLDGIAAEDTHKGYFSIDKKTGRHIVCGTGSYLYYHGFDTSVQRAAEEQMLANPGESADLFEEYGVDYIYISGHEHNDFNADENWFFENCELLYDQDGVRIFAYDADGAAQSAE